MALVRRSSTISQDDGGKKSTTVFSPRSTKSIPSLMRKSSRASLPDTQISSPRRKFEGSFTRSSSTSSMAGSTSGSKRVSFNSVTKRVTNLLKITMKLKPKVNPIPETEFPVSGEIEELPKSPRFSSFLSPEAQFAMMKGYEDVLHQEISASQPEIRPHLRRNRTPVHTIEIKDVENEKVIDSNNPCLMDEKGQENTGFNLMQMTDRRRSLPISIGSTTTGKSAEQTDSSHGAIPLDRRLMLTYRLESAMDILDKVRYQNGNHSISPRLPVNKRAIPPATEYNCWTSVWRTEFKCGGRTMELPRRINTARS